MSRYVTIWNVSALTKKKSQTLFSGELPIREHLGSYSNEDAAKRSGEYAIATQKYTSYCIDVIEIGDNHQYKISTDFDSKFI